MTLFDFAYCGNFDSKIDFLAQMAENENWGENNKVLRNYIKYYLQEIYDRKIFKETQKDNNIYYIFNTGLLTKNYEEIFALFEPNKNNNNQPYFLKGFYKESYLSSHGICNSNELPSLVNFFENFEDLYFDPNKNIVLNKDHILNERDDRIPVDYPKEALILLLEGEIKTLKKRLARNYRLAVPQYYKGEIQFLLPLQLATGRTVSSLVVSLKGNEYVAHTIFTLEMAYNNARLLMKPESEWLTI